MSLDGKLLARAKTRLDTMRAESERQLEERRREVYRKAPRIAEIDAEMRSTVIDAIGVAMSHGDDPVEAIDAIRLKNLSLQEERALTLIKAGYAPDYLADNYRCPKCRDTGYNGTELCSCLMDLYRDEQRKELSQMLKLGEETFDTFNLDYYSDVPDPQTGVSPRQNMEIIFETCLEYARKFSPKSLNLFLRGGTGLGKTFLSTSIAKVVSERGFSVVYDTAGSIFAKYEQEKFSRSPEDVDAARADIRRLETCDLLIIDDLGTELASNFVTSALYTLVNNRLLAAKKMVINSNLSLRDLARRYSPAVMSRLEGEFEVYNFTGRDIRRIKNGL